MNISIKDLEMNKQLDAAAMSRVDGGRRFVPSWVLEMQRRIAYFNRPFGSRGPVVIGW